MENQSENLKKAPPSFPVEVLVFDSNPMAGDDFIVVESESIARTIAEYRTDKDIQKKNTVAKTNVEQMFEEISQGKIASLPVVIKADVHGSAEAIDNSIKNSIKKAKILGSKKVK